MKKIKHSNWRSAKYIVNFLINNIERNLTNNYRKIHGLPMYRHRSMIKGRKYIR